MSFLQARHHTGIATAIEDGDIAGLLRRGQTALYPVYPALHRLLADERISSSEETIAAGMQSIAADPLYINCCAVAGIDSEEVQRCFEKDQSLPTMDDGQEVTARFELARPGMWRA
jgi:hypothetical protein